jgi:hypothetical protein
VTIHPSSRLTFDIICSTHKSPPQTENVKNILLKNLLDACGGALGFFTIGYGIAYGGDEVGKTFLGNGDFALRGFDPSDPDKGDDWSFFFFQFAFAATAATIVAGTVAERCKMAAYLCYSGTFFSFVDSPMISFLLCLLVRLCLTHIGLLLPFQSSLPRSCTQSSHTRFGASTVSFRPF